LVSDRILDLVEGELRLIPIENMMSVSGFDQYFEKTRFNFFVKGSEGCKKT